MIFLETTQDERFGIYLDDVLRMNMRGYAGQFENFMFSSVRGWGLHLYKPTSINPKEFKSEEELFKIGPPKSSKNDNSSSICPTIRLVPQTFKDHSK